MMKKLDLHGVCHADVKRSVIRFVEKNWDTKQKAVIITGHSPQMKKIVIKILDEYKLKYRIGDIFKQNTATIEIDEM